MTLYFVVRTDVPGDSGSQRVFGAYDTYEEAVNQIAHLRSRMVGQFSVFKGSPA